MNEILTNLLLILYIKAAIFWFLSTSLSVFFVPFRSWKWARLWAISAAICLTLATLFCGVIIFEPETAAQPQLYESLCLLSSGISLSLGLSIILYLFRHRRTAYALTGLATALIFFHECTSANPYFLFIAVGPALYAGMLVVATFIVGLIRLLKNDRSQALHWGYCCLTSLVYVGVIYTFYPFVRHATGTNSQFFLAILVICPIIYLTAIEKVARPLTTPEH